MFASQKGTVTKYTLWNMRRDSEIKESRGAPGSSFNALQVAPWWVSGRSMGSVRRAAFGVSGRS